MNTHTFITISRQFGSGGKEIADIVARKLGVRCYDRQILYLAAEKLGHTSLDAASILNDAYQVAGASIESTGENGFFTSTRYNKMFKEQSKLILNIAQQEDAVFLGRCADAILSREPGCYSFFIYADETFRTERAKKYYDSLSLADLNAEDRIRKSYYRHYTGKSWGDPANYDLMINTSAYSLEDAADLILHYVAQRKNHV